MIDEYDDWSGGDGDDDIPPEDESDDWSYDWPDGWDYMSDAYGWDVYDIDVDIDYVGSE